MMDNPGIASADGALLDTIRSSCRHRDGSLNEDAAYARLTEAVRAGNAAAAEAVAQALVTHDASLLRLTNMLAELAYRGGRKQEAVSLYERVLAPGLSSGDARKPRALIEFAYALDETGQPVRRVDEAYRAAICASPYDRVLLGRWMKLLQREGQDVRAAFVELQTVSRDLIGSIVTILVQRGTPLDALEPIFHERFARFCESRTFSRFDTIWQSFARLKPMSAGARERLRQELGPTSHLYFLLRDPPLRRVSLTVGSSVTEARTTFGLNLRALKTYLEDIFLDTDSNPWFAYLASQAVFPSEAARRSVLSRERFCLYQDRMVADRRLRFLHPVDKVEVEPIDSFIFSGRTVYTFPGRTAFLLITGGGGSKVLAGYLPGQNVLIDFGGGIHSAISDYALASLFGTMLQRLCDHAELYEAAVSAQRGESGPRRICLGMGTAQNFAHHLWNYYPAFERLVQAGLADHVDEIYSAGSEFFGPAEKLFPEFGRARFIGYPRGMLDPHPFSAEHLLAQPGSYFIPTTLRERLTNAMQNRPHADPAAAAPRFAGTRPFPIVWIGLRLGDKSWSGQETEAASFIDRISQAHPDALFLLDGFSYPVGTDDSSAAWGETIARLKGVTAAITAACRVPERVIDMVGNTLRESVLWAREVDLYVTPHGTSQHKVGWLTAAPGIIYATKELEAVPRERRPGSWEAEGVALPHYLFGEPASSATRRGLNDQRTKIDNVALDGDALADLALRLIAERAKA